LLVIKPSDPPYHKRSLTCFVIGWNIDSKVLIGKVRQVTRDVVKSEV